MASKPLDAAGPISVVESQELAACLTSKKKILIVDSRSLLEYNSKCILNAINVSCSKLLKRRLQQDKMSVTELLQVENPRQPVSTDPGTPVVVYDQCSEHPESLSSDLFIYILLKKLANHYTQVSLLKGGIVEFQTHFGALCERRNLLPLDLAPRGDPLSPGSAGLDSVDGYAASQRSPPFLTAMSVPVCNIGPTRILDHLYLGSQSDAMDADVLRANGVTHILNVSNNPKTPHVADTSFFRIDVNDGYGDKMLPHFQKGFMFLEKVRQAGGRALVHCLAGISRSPTLAIAYLMQFMHMSSDDAYRYVKERRANIAPNFNFLGQLLEFERQLRAKRQNSDSAASTPDVSPLPMAVASASASPSPQLLTGGRPASFLPFTAPAWNPPLTLSGSSHTPSLSSTATTTSAARPPTSLSFTSPTRPPTSLSFTSTTASTTSSCHPPSSLSLSGSSSTSTTAPAKRPPSSLSLSGSSSTSTTAPAKRPPSSLSLPGSSTSTTRPPPTLSCPRPAALSSASKSPRPPSLASEAGLKKKRPCLNRPSHLPAEKTAKTSTSAVPVSPMYDCLLTRTAPPPASLTFGLRATRPSRQARLDLPRSATVGQISSPTTALARLSFDNTAQLAAFPSTSLEQLRFMPCHSAMDRGPPQENLGLPAASAAPTTASGRLRSPLTPRKQLVTTTSTSAEAEAGRKSRSLEDMLEGLVSPCPAARTRGEGPCRLRDHSLHQSSSSLSSSAASGSHHSSMEILQCS